MEGGGVSEGMGDVAKHDVGGANGGAIAGTILPDPATTASGAAGGAIVSSATVGACKLGEALSLDGCCC